ncbi:uncharacterized protein [Phaseolus vulgaris]|uniref:uncharacterized protein n=1 Tax=Phaseolus vulgaris TaxID=3885 RepID=UPI0035CBD8DE
MQFLRGLNDQYKNICSHVLLMDPIPAISKKISLVVQQLSTVVPAPSLHSLNSSRTTTCNFCGKYGHTEAVCFRKVGFPSADVKTSKFSSTRKNCTFCNRLGHTVDTCYKKHGFPPGYKSINRTSQANNMFTTNSSSESFSKKQDVKGIQFTSQQCQFLTNILRQQNLEDHAPHAQINQVGTFSTDKITNTEQSSTGQSHPREDCTVEATGGLYPVTTLSASSRSKPHNFAPLINCNITDKTLWHYRLGHPSHERLHVLRKQYPFITIDTHHVCDTCSRAKQRKLPFTLSTTATSAIFYLVHFDIWGPCSITSMQGFRYFLTIVDDYSRYTWVILLHNKSEVRSHIIHFTVFVQNHFQTNIKTIRTDNGVEFAMSSFYASKGIIHQTHTKCNQGLTFSSKSSSYFLGICCKSCCFLNKFYSYSIT